MEDNTAENLESKDATGTDTTGTGKTEEVKANDTVIAQDSSNDSDSTPNKPQEDSKTEEDKEDKSVKKDNEIAEDSFLFYLEKELDAPYIRSNLRITSSGLFINENCKDRILELYLSWSKEVINSSKSEEKAKKKLLKNEGNIKYLIDGKLCIPGYLIEIDTPSANKNKTKIAYYQSALLDTKSYFHPRDPIALNNESFRLKNHSLYGNVIEVINSKHPTYISTKCLQEFSEVISDSRKNSFKSNSLRDYIPVMCKKIQKSRIIPKKNKLWIPQDLKKDSEILYLGLGKLVFAKNKENLITTCYELDGKNMTKILFSELEKLKKGSFEPKGLSLEKREGSRYLGKIRIDKKAFKLTPKCLYQFIRGASKSRDLKTLIPNRYTLADLLGSFSKFFKKSEMIEERKIYWALGKRKVPNADYRKNNSWIFTIINKSILNDCLEIRHKNNKTKKSGEKIQSKTKTKNVVEKTAAPN